jgi:hypothetical protein
LSEVLDWIGLEPMSQLIMAELQRQLAARRKMEATKKRNVQDQITCRAIEQKNRGQGGRRHKRHPRRG